MRIMIRNNKWKTIISSLVILLPILFGLIFWNELPANMTTHFGIDGNADGQMGKALAVFLPPLILLGLHWLCLIMSSAEWKNKGQSQKTINLVFMIMPFISLFVNSITYAVAFGWEICIEILLPVMFGILFIVMGNYMPKAVRNRSFGVRIYYTLNNDENWSKTHRFAGKLYFICGLATLFTIFLPFTYMFAVFMTLVFGSTLAIFLYSYGIYRKHKKAGIKYAGEKMTKTDKKIAAVTGIIVAVILVGVAVLMFTGSIEVNLGDNTLVIDTTYWEKAEIKYEEIDRVEYFEKIPSSIRTYGFFSARLALGSFKSNDIGGYTRYTYTGCDAGVLIEVSGNILIVNAKDAAATEALYNAILEKTK